VHFLLLGAAIFVLFQFGGNRSEPDGKIVVTPGKVEQLVMGFSRTWQRPPTNEELSGLIEDYVKEEVFYREALAIGLDKDDTIVRRRMRQKFEFLIGDATVLTPPADQDLQAWLEKNPDKFRIEPKLALRQVYVNVHRRGDAASKEATKLLARLNNAGKNIDSSTLGDTSLLPHELPLSSVDEVARVFGEAFAQQVTGLETGRWAGPVQSGYGLHLVYVCKRTGGSVIPLTEVREEVQKEWLADRHREMMETSYRKLRGRYSIVVESRQVAGSAASQSGSAANAAQRP